MQTQPTDDETGGGRLGLSLAKGRGGGVRSYARGDLVWVKLPGFPWWPSQVRSTRDLDEGRLRLRLLYTNDVCNYPLVSDKGETQVQAWGALEPRDPKKLGSGARRILTRAAAAM